MRDAELRKRVKTDEHSPSKVRINGVVYNMPEFYAAFPILSLGTNYSDRLNNGR